LLPILRARGLYAKGRGNGQSQNQFHATPQKTLSWVEDTLVNSREEDAGVQLS
jgi:hypothetical protein